MDLLKKHKKHFFDIPELFEYQKDVFDKLSKKQNTLAIIPTGGGKSLLYQLWALELKGITIVVCPLLALMEEQVNELNEKRRIKALALNSNISFEEQRDYLRNLKTNDFKLIYVSPERLQNPFFRASLIASRIEISMIVVDEAHCISQWGSSFRPDYGQISSFVEFIETNKFKPTILCLTATLSLRSRIDILNEFKVEEKNTYISKSIIRDNLKLNFQQVENENEKSKYLLEFLIKHKPKKSIAYLYSKMKCENYADEFSDKYITDWFHAGVESEEKSKVYSKFLNDKIELLFATTAFGMGINIPNIESIIHLQIPYSVEEYYQQVGRGWRNKTVYKDCFCLALWSDKNFEVREEDLESQKVDSEIIQNAYKSLIGGIKNYKIGQIVNKDKDAFLNSNNFNLQLLKHLLEKRGVIRTIGEINGTPQSILFYKNTEIWDKIIHSSNSGINSFRYVSDDLNISITDIIEHLYQQDLLGNIKTLPAMKKDIYFQLLATELSSDIVNSVISEINETVDFRINQLQELKDLFNTENTDKKLIEILS